MKTGAAFGVLVLMCFTAAATCKTVTAPTERLVEDVSLQALFHTAQPWQLKIYQPISPEGPFGTRPVRVCFVGPSGARDLKNACTALFGGTPSAEDGRSVPVQTLDSAKLEMLPGANGAASRPAVVIRATFAGGGAGELKDVYVWSDTSLDHAGSFTQTFKSEVSQAGDQRFVTHGPLAGTFVEVEQVYEGNESNMEVPVHYAMTVYRPAPLGYVKVLSILSEKRYPSNHTRDGLRDAIKVLTPIISRALKAVYPQGMSALTR